MRCFHVLFFLLALAITSPAKADTACFEGKRMTAVLIQNGFIPVADLEIDGRPGIIFARLQTGEYFVFAYFDKIICEVSHGDAFHLYKMREG